MLQVKLNTATSNIEVRFKYNESYINRLKALRDCKYDSTEKMWIVQREAFPSFMREFDDEIMYVTPRWVITGEAPPDYSKVYNLVSKVEPALNPPYKPYSFQSFGANFLATMAMRYGFGCLLDDMGTGSY